MDGNNTNACAVKPADNLIDEPIDTSMWVFISLVLVLSTVHARRSGILAELPGEIQEACIELRCTVEESTSYKIPLEGLVKHALFEEVLAKNNVQTDGNSTQHQADDMVYTGFAVAGNIHSISLEVCDEQLFRDEPVMSDTPEPLGMNVPRICVDNCNTFVWIYGVPETEFTITHIYENVPGVV